MIILKVIGGLGNQMFQLAAARRISLESNEKIILDCSSYKKYKIRQFSSENLYISNNIEYIEDCNLKLFEIIYYRITILIYSIYRRSVRVLFKKNVMGEKIFSKISKYGLYFNFDRNFYKIPNNNRNIKIFYGYFQSAKYYEKFENEIKNELRVKTPITEKERCIIRQIEKDESVAISIRIGDDYLNHKDLNVFTEEYYYKAMDYIYNKNNDVVFYIFSDCIERVKKTFNFNYKVVYIEDFNDYESLRMMYMCKHFIISNSSFSWWGSYLSKSNSKIVIAPKDWYNNTPGKIDIHLDDMILM